MTLSNQTGPWAVVSVPELDTGNNEEVSARAYSTGGEGTHWIAVYEAIVLTRISMHSIDKVNIGPAVGNLRQSA